MNGHPTRCGTESALAYLTRFEERFGCFTNVNPEIFRGTVWGCSQSGIYSDLQVCTKQQHQRSFPTNTERHLTSEMSGLKPSALRRLLQLPTSANDPSFQLVLHELRSPLLHTQLHPRDKVTSIRSQQTWQVQQPITVRLREALCQKASSSMRSSPVSGPSRVVKLLQTRSNTTTMKHDIERLWTTRFWSIFYEVWVLFRGASEQLRELAKHASCLMEKGKGQRAKGRNAWMTRRVRIFFVFFVFWTTSNTLGILCKWTRFEINLPAFKWFMTL